MKIKSILTILVGTAVAFAACNDDDIIKKDEIKPANPGDKIVFGGVLDFENANGGKSRTVYGDRLDGYTEIKWYTGDQVRIYCAQAEDEDGTLTPICDYSVVNGLSNPYGDEDSDGSNFEMYHSTGLTAAPVDDTQAALCWGTGTHTFYGVYPAYAQLNNSSDTESVGAAGRLDLTGNTLKGLLPNKQTPLGETKYTTTTDKTTGSTHYTIQPAMRYAYMVAKTETDPISTVSLIFKPIVTAVEVTLINNSTVTTDGVTEEKAIENIEMLSITSDKVICGGFTTTISGGSGENATFTTTMNETEDAYKTVSIPVDGINLKYGDKITFTVFLLLDESVTGLEDFTVTILAGNTTKSAKLKGATDGTIIVQAKKKNFINNVSLALNDIVTNMTPDNWISYIPDIQADGTDYLLSELSIPGAGGAASKSIYDDGDGTSAEQTLSITDLWAQGVRCFEFAVDKSSDLGNQKIYCNNVATDKTLNAAVNEVVTCLKNHPTEFAILNVVYQENLAGGWTRQVGADDGFSAYFNSWWVNYKTNTIPTYTYTYTDAEGNSKSKSVEVGVLSLDSKNPTTVADARGKVFMLARHTARGLDPGWYTGVNNTNSASGTYTTVLGWGDHADNWYGRGYGVAHTSNPGSSLTGGPSTGASDRPYAVGTDETVDAGDLVAKTSNFEMAATNSLGTADYSTHTSVWVQEWRRVMPTATIQSQFGITGLPAYGEGTSGDGFYYDWSPSAEEKWDDIVSTTEMALSTTETKYPLFVNSLCGYFIDGFITESYQPRATFQRYYGYSSWLFKDHWTYGLDDKYMDGTFSVDLTNKGTIVEPKTDPKPNNILNADDGWGPYNVAGGYKGNIGAFAQWVNNRFYNYLLSLQVEGTLDGTKGMGIVMMDRVSDDKTTNAAGYYIPRIIISNNQFNTTSATANGLSIVVVNEEVSSGDGATIYSLRK